MAQHVDAGEGSANFIQAQDGGKGLDPLGLDKADGGPVPLEGLLVEELDPAQRNGAGHPGPTTHIGAVQEILP